MRDTPAANIAGYIAVILTIVALSTQNLYLKTIAGGVLISGIGISFIILQRDKEADKEQKQMSWFAFLSVAIVMYYLIGAFKH